MNINKIGDWVKVVRDGNIFKEDAIFFGVVVATGTFENNPIITININNNKFITVAQSLVVETRKENERL